jgi:hypothetical protein
VPILRALALPILRALALPFTDHPDFLDEWNP